MKAINFYMARNVQMNIFKDLFLIMIIIWMVINVFFNNKGVERIFTNRVEVIQLAFANWKT